MSDDSFSDSNSMVTETRIKVLNPLRKVFVVTEDGLFRLVGDVNPETTWAWRVDRFREGSERCIRCLVVEPGTGHLLMGHGSPGAGLDLSEDGGRTWRPAPDWPEERPAHALTAPGAGQVVVGSAPASLHRGELPEGRWTLLASLDGVAASEAPVAVLARDPSRPARWLAALEGGPLLRSEDQGATWIVASGAVDARVVVHTRGGVALAAGAAGLWRSPEAGEAWSPVEAFGEGVGGLCVDVAGTLFVAMVGASDAAILSSTDKGVHWDPVTPSRDLPPASPGAATLEADSLHPGIVYYGAGDRVFMVGAEGCRLLAEGLPPVRRLLVL